MRRAQIDWGTALSPLRVVYNSTWLNSGKDSRIAKPSTEAGVLKCLKLPPQMSTRLGPLRPACCHSIRTGPIENLCYFAHFSEEISALAAHSGSPVCLSGGG